MIPVEPEPVEEEKIVIEGVKTRTDV